MAQRDQGAERDDDDDSSSAPHHVGSQIWRRRNKRGHGQNSLRVDRRIGARRLCHDCARSSMRVVVSADCHRDANHVSRCDSANGRALAREAAPTISPSGIGPRTTRRPNRQGKRNVQHPIDHPTRRRAPRCSLQRPSPARRTPCRSTSARTRRAASAPSSRPPTTPSRSPATSVVDRDAADAGAARDLARHVLVRGRAELLQLHADAVVRRHPRRQGARRHAAARTFPMPGTRRARTTSSPSRSRRR